MDFLTCCGEKLLERVIVALGPQIGYLISYRNNIEMLKEKVEDLKNEKDTKQRLINDARRNGETIVDEVQHWMSRVDEIIVQAQQFFEEERQANTGCGRTSCPNLWSRHQLSRRANKMTLEVVKIFEKRKFDIIAYLNFPQQVPDPIIGDSNEGFESRMPTMNQIMEALQDPTVNMIGLYGLGGVGKTTIAREVEKNVKAKKMFDEVIFVTITDNLNIENIQGQIAKSLGMDLDQQTERMRYRLKERLKDQKNLLLILDDLWEKLDLDIIGFPFDDDGKNDNSKKCRKILFTSRERKLLSNQMECEKTINVNVLSNEEAWELFKRKAKLHDDKNFPPEAYEIVKLCAGLPIRINAAAGALKNENNPNEWKSILHKLENPLRRNITGIEQADSIFWVSYDKLDQELQSIFLLCAMLSHDPLIKNLLMYSVGLDLLEGVRNMEEAEVELRALAKKLEDKSLLLESYFNDNFIMHDVVRDFALSIAYDKWKAFMGRRSGLNGWPDKDKLKDCIRICLDEGDLPPFPEELYGPKVQFFLLHMKDLDVHIPSTFFKSMHDLKVIRLGNVRFSSLPSSLRLLKELRTLCLHSCVLEDIAEVGKLKDLKILSLAQSIIKRLPYELGQLTCLQMLNLANCSNLEMIPPNVLSNLKSLEILCMENSFNRWEAEGSSEADANASLAELKHLSKLSSLDVHIPNASVLPKDLFLETNLERYKILIGENWNWSDFIIGENCNWSGKYETSKTLKLRLKSGIPWEHGVQKLLERVEDLYLDDVSGITNVITGVLVFNELRTLTMSGLSTLTDFYFEENAIDKESNKIFGSLFSNKVSFPKLEILRLSFLNSLIPSIWDDRLPHSSFSNLKELIVINCGSLVKLVPLHVLKSLSHLEELEVRGCELLEMVFDFEELNSYNEIQSSHLVVPLKKLKLRELPKLKHVWSNDPQGIVSFGSLSQVVAFDCKSLTSIFPASIAKDMRHLEKLQLFICGMEVIVAKDEVSESGAPTFEFPRLTSLKLEWLPNLRNFYPSRHTSEWPCLQELRIYYCDQLKIFENEVSSSSAIQEEEILDLKYPLFFHEKVSFHKLEILKLSFLKSLIPSIWDDRLLHSSFSNLKELIMEGCGSLVKLVPLHVLKSLSHLEELEVRSCELLEMVFDFEGLNGNEETQDVPLKRLLLRGLPKLKHVWSNDPQGIVSFRSLRKVSAFYCGSLVKLVPLHILKSLSHLEELEVRGCELLEMVFDFEGLNGNEETQLLQLVVPLKRLSLWSLPKLKHVWSNGPQGIVSFRSLRQVYAFDCGSLVKLVPLHILKSLSHLEELEVHGCELLEMVFDFEELNSYKETQSLQLVVPLKTLKLWELPKLKHVWSNDPQGIVSFRSLRQVSAFDCKSLTSMFPASIAKDMRHLEKLQLFKCGIEVIVAKDEVSEFGAPTFEFPRLTLLKLEWLPNLRNFYPNRHTSEWPCLQKLEIGSCDQLKIFENEVSSSSTIQEEEILDLKYPLFFHEKVSFHKLEILKLSFLKSLIPSIWDDRLLHSSFSNLKELIMEGCGSLVKLVPLHVLKSLSHLEELEVRSCELLEMVFDFEGLNGNEETQDVPLKRLLLRGLPKLKHVWSNDPQGIVSFRSLRKVSAFYCGSLVKLVPLHILKSLSHLEELEVRGCELLEMVFDFEGLNGNEETQLLQLVVPLKRLSLWSLPKLKHVWSNGPQGIVSFRSLRQVYAFDCGSLTSMFPASIAKGMLHLEKLEIDCCNGIEVIVAKDEVSESGALTFEFPKLTFLRLEFLQNLRNFYPNRHTPEWSSLQKLKIRYCGQLKIFENEVSSSSALQEEEIPNSNYPLFFHEKVIPNLEVLELQGKQALMIWNGQFPACPFHRVKKLDLDLDLDDDDNAATFSYELLKRFSNLEELRVGGWIREIFSCKEPLGDDARQVTPFRKLELYSLRKVKHLWNEHSTLDILQSLETLDVKFCDDLINLGPSFISLGNLTDIHVDSCDELTNLLTSSTARSLVHLTRLTIKGCKRIEEIITKQGEDVEKEIIFNKLGYLKLDGLPSLKSFCSHNYIFRFPLLDKVIITECPRLKMFCPRVIHTPSLKGVEVAEDQKFWETNLNKTIQQRFTTQEVVPTLQSLALDQEDAAIIRNGKFQVEPFPEVETLYVESFIDEWVSFPYSFLERFPNLYELHVEHSSFEEIFPSQEPNVDHIGKIAPFEKLCLADLDQLKNVWKDDSQLQPIHQNLKILEIESCSSLIKLAPSSASFENLTRLKVSSCHQLIYLVTNSTAKSLVNLRILKIRDCERMEEIITNETTEDLEGGIAFDKLWDLELTDLPSLKRFCSQSHSFKFPELLWITISRCLQLKMFCPGVLETPKLRKVKIEEDDMDWKDQGDLNKTIELLLSAKDGKNI